MPNTRTDGATYVSEAPRWVHLWSFFWRVLVLINVVCIAFVLVCQVALPLTEVAIKWRPSIVLISTALVFYFSHFATRKGLSYILFGARLRLDGIYWKRINTYTIFTLLVLAIGNVYVIYNYRSDAWIFYKQNIQGLALLIFIIISACFALKPWKNLTNPWSRRS